MEKGKARKKRLFRAKRASFVTIELISTATELMIKFSKINSDILDLVGIAKASQKSVSILLYMLLSRSLAMFSSGLMVLPGKGVPSEALLTPKVGV